MVEGSSGSGSGRNNFGTRVGVIVVEAMRDASHGMVVAGCESFFFCGRNSGC